MKSRLIAVLGFIAALAAPGLAAAAVYGPWGWVDKTAQPTTTTDTYGNTITSYPQLSGAYAITDQATYQANLSVLSPYVATGPLPAQSVLAGDDPASPKVTVILHFPDFTTAQQVITQVNGPVTQAPSSLPPEVAMYRIKVIMKQTASSRGGSGTLYDDVPTFIATLSTSQQLVANEMWADAPNLEVSGSFAQGFKAWEGLTDAQWDQLISNAVNLAL